MPQDSDRECTLTLNGIETKARNAIMKRRKETKIYAAVMFTRSYLMSTASAQQQSKEW